MSEYFEAEHPDLVNHVEFKKRWPDFIPSELACSCCNKIKIQYTFMDNIQKIRDESGIVMAISSAYRCPKHNASVSATKSTTGPHTTGHSVDIVVSSAAARKLTRVALKREYRMTGIGIKQKGDYKKRFLHFDNLPKGKNQPRPHMWSY